MPMNDAPSSLVAELRRHEALIGALSSAYPIDINVSNAIYVDNANQGSPTSTPEVASQLS